MDQKVLAMKRIHISNYLSLPLDSVTQTFAILGIRGSGKTNTGTVMFEEMLKCGQQGCVIDPVNAWYGIRSSKDGKSAGYKVIVIGGENGDLPLEGTNGPLLADFVVESGASVVFSLRHLSMNDQRTFAQGFAERLYHLKGKSANRSPLHLFVDEADEFIPQRIPHGFERMFGAFDRLVRRGRSSGIGLTMISQRPQVLNKDTLSQCETLICHRLLHQLDRKAVEAWIMAHADDAKALEFWTSLATLGKGDAWIWSPEWAEIFERVHIRERETFDSSFTPKAGQRVRKVSKLAQVDLEQLRQKLTATIEKAKQDDPRELRNQIAELKREMASKGKASVNVPSKTIEKVVQKRVEVRVPFVPKYVLSAMAKANEAIRNLDDAVTRARTEEVSNPIPSVMDRKIMSYTESKALEELKRPSLIMDKLKLRPEPASNGSGKLRAGAERMLTALVQWSPNGMHIGQMRSHAGMKKSGTFTTYMSDLRKGGYIEERDGLVFATDQGLQYFGGNVPDAPRTTEDVMSVWEGKLRDGARRILRVLVDAGGEPVSMEDLTAKSGLAKSGTFTTYLSDLRTARLIETGKGMAKANKETLFL